MRLQDKFILMKICCISSSCLSSFMQSLNAQHSCLLSWPTSSVMNLFVTLSAGVTLTLKTRLIDFHSVIGLLRDSTIRTIAGAEFLLPLG